METGLRNIVLKIIHEETVFYPYGIYQIIRERGGKKYRYSSVRWVFHDLVKEGTIYKLSLNEIRRLGLRTQPNLSPKSGTRPPISRSYYARA